MQISHQFEQIQSILLNKIFAKGIPSSYGSAWSCSICERMDQHTINSIRYQDSSAPSKRVFILW